MTTVADQDYIKAIYRLEGEQRAVSTSSLAAILGVRPASVSGMLRKLNQIRMVNLQRYKGVRLTDRGRRTALKVVRRHRLIELFLVEILGLTWDRVHEEADRLEHAISDQVLARMDELLGFPRFCPHGSPIPTSDGDLSHLPGVRLGQWPIGRVARVCEVDDRDPELLQHLSRIGLVPGAKFRVGNVLPFDGTLVLQIGRQTHHISPKVASAVRVDADE